MAEYIYSKTIVHNHLDRCLAYFLNNNERRAKVFLNHFLIKCTTTKPLDTNHYDDDDWDLIKILKRYYTFLALGNVMSECDLRNIVKLLLDNNNSASLFKYLEDFHINYNKLSWKNKQNFLRDYRHLKRDAFKNPEENAIIFIKYIKLLFSHINFDVNRSILFTCNLNICKYIYNLEREKEEKVKEGSMEV